MPRLALGVTLSLALTTWWCSDAVACARGGCRRCCSPVGCSSAAPAWIEVKIPDGSRLFFGETAATQTAGVQTYATPPLVPGWDYRYTLRVESGQAGAPPDVRDILVRAGTLTRIDFTTPNSQGGPAQWRPRSGAEERVGPPVQEATRPADVPDAIDL